MSAILKRPFGKLRLIAHGFDVFSTGEVLQIDGIEVSFKETTGMLPTDRFDALNGEFKPGDDEQGDDVKVPETYTFT